MREVFPTLTFEYLTGSEGRTQTTLVNAFRVSLDGRRIFAAFAVRDGDWLTPIGEMALRRALFHAHAERSGIQAVLGDPTQAHRRVLRAFHAAPEGMVVVLICATPAVYDAAFVPFWSRPGVLFMLPNGRLAATPTPDQVAAVKAEWDRPRMI